MASFLVTRKEVWNSILRVEADSPEEAVALVDSGKAEDEVSLDYSFTLDTDLWEVEKEYINKKG
jgi:hypothetical protein